MWRILAAVGVLWPIVALAQFREVRGPEPALPDVADQNSEAIMVDPGFARVVRFDKPFKTIVVGDESVVHVTAQSDRAITIIATSPNGLTNLVVLDEAGGEIFSGTGRVMGAMCVAWKSGPRTHCTNTGPISAPRPRVTAPRMIRSRARSRK